MFNQWLRAKAQAHNNEPVTLNTTDVIRLDLTSAQAISNAQELVEHGLASRVVCSVNGEIKIYT